MRINKSILIFYMFEGIMDFFEKRFWMMLYGISMILQGLILVLTFGLINTHLFIKVAYLYSTRETNLARKFNNNY